MDATPSFNAAAEDLAALAGEVQELGPISDETAAETERLAQTLETLTQQQLIQQFNQSAEALTQLEQASVLSRDKLAQLRAEQQTSAGQARVLTDQERLLASEVKQLERQLISQSAAHTRLHVGLTQAGLDTRNLAQEQQRLQRELRESAAQSRVAGAAAPGAGVALAAGAGFKVFWAFAPAGKAFVATLFIALCAAPAGAASRGE